ncbi:uncharacterized protein LOC110115135 [Dendrobium catenatum]|uniref:uncharacterized protein LOC110115135 n=1 Tax=Dendrobium catenatum TaxID=906689 RepID=UPI0009F23765|nr:uncharacterized protein LOC110115135 [Dendrobium catenatum]
MTREDRRPPVDGLKSTEESNRRIKNKEGSALVVSPIRSRKDCVTPLFGKSRSSLKQKESEASSSDLNIYVNKFGCPNAISDLWPAINANISNNVNNKYQSKDKLPTIPCSNFSINPVSQSGIDGAGLRDSDAKISENVSKVISVNAWKKTQHIKINHDMDSTPVTDDGIAMVMNSELENVNSQILRNSLVIKVLCNNIPFPVCSRELRRQWARVGNFHLITLGLDWILCSFSKPEVVEEVLEGGPWFIGGNIIRLDKWSPNFSLESLKGLTAPIWIRLPCLPLHCWDEQNICRIASKIGTPIYLPNSFQDRNANISRWEFF